MYLISPWRLFTQRRYLFTILVFFGYMNVYSLRVNMSVAVVAMTGESYILSDNGTEIRADPEFTWDNKLIGFLLSSFFYGYITTQLFGGYLAIRIGGKQIFGIGLAVSSAITFISPWLAEAGIYYMLCSRVVLGIFEGVTSSSMYTMWSKWIPPQERSRMLSIANSGVFAGTVFGMTFYGYISSIIGWRSIFWLSGGLGLLWYLIWMLVQSESPQEDKKISKEELDFIVNSLKNEVSTEKLKVSWCSVMTSKPVWALAVAISCETWGFYTLLSLLPKYFKDTFQFDVSKSGILSALPYIAMGVAIQVVGQISDRIIIKKIMSVTTVRKTFIGIGFFAQAIFLLAASFWPGPAGTVFFLVVAVASGSLVIIVETVNCLDMAPRFSGIIFGMSNTVGAMTGMISPTVAGYIVSTDNPTPEQWRMVFYISVGLYVLGAIFFIIFGSGEVQPWDAPESLPEKEAEKEAEMNKTNEQSKTEKV